MGSGFFSSWTFWALLSATFAALTAIFAKVGIEHVNSDFATLLRTAVVLVSLALILYATGQYQPLSSISPRSYLFLALSGLATGASWLCYFRALKLEPRDVRGVYRGFKVDKREPLASVRVGESIILPVTRNHGFSSWSLTERPTHRFSGAGKGRIGLVVRLQDVRGVTPVLAPPHKTSRWFNAMYLEVIGKSFRPKEEEYLIAAHRIHVTVVRVKR